MPDDDNESTRDRTAGHQPSCDESAHDCAADESSCDESSRDESPGHESAGDESAPDLATRYESTGDKPSRHESTGHKSPGSAGADHRGWYRADDRDERTSDAGSTKAVGCRGEHVATSGG